VPLPDEDPPAAVEVRSKFRGVRLIELWRPPGREARSSPVRDDPASGHHRQDQR